MYFTTNNGAGWIKDFGVTSEQRTVGFESSQLELQANDAKSLLRRKEQIRR
jgi:hypothetical protein